MLIRYIEKKILSKKLNLINERKEFGYFSSIVGIVVNVLLFGVKIIVGLSSNSIALIADSINNLSDTATSIIGLVGFKLSVKPADKEHPFGHGRTEYISSLIVSFVIILIGYELIKDSYARIVTPTTLRFDWFILLILIATIVIKLWLSTFYLKMSKKIDSKVLKTASIDSLTDVWATSSVLISFVIFNFSGLVIDGYVGILVAIFIIYNGLKFIKESVDIIIGYKPDFELIKLLEENVESYEGIINAHDIIVHDYGPMSKMATAHVEISSNLSLLVAHEIIDHIERGIKQKFGITLLLHLDPIEDTCEVTLDIKERVYTILKGIHGLKSIHDFRVIEEAQNYTVFFELIAAEELTQGLKECKKEVHKILEKELPYTFIINMRKENRYIN
ncbi:cation diffusion facilitator family transporter [Alkalibaculum sp. M08DMB]|uniref:Cation diffusion facilitator family transporter n=1 Tax=Alkalibaculum sporogenes TaxID=2655001 RepID=A0A6A7K5Y9_9FIRM|nr:cation diffusion facilitator family transporter [Alkalibaculum sporogenes]MPW24846.1 cation diffusion facilitator family transporter [Alkalibaculum sporogenes]